MMPSSVFPVETHETTKTNIDSKEFTGSDFHQNANFHGKYQRAKILSEKGSSRLPNLHQILKALGLKISIVSLSETIRCSIRRCEGFYQGV